MGILDGLFGGSKPSDRKIASTVQALERRHGEPALRYQAADKLAAWGTKDALEGLLKRFTVTSASEMSDDEEKAYVAELLEKKDQAVVVPLLERYLRREAEVSWALRLLAKLVSPEDFRDKVLAVLEDSDPHFDPHPQRKVELLHALRDWAKDPRIAAVSARFLDDTDDTVRVAAVGMLASSGREEDVTALVDAMLASRDRARVLAAGCAALAECGLSVKGRKADVETVMPEGYYVTRDGILKRLGR